MENFTKMPVYSGSSVIGYCVTSAKEALELMAQERVTLGQDTMESFVPEVIYCNSEKKVTVVKWADGTETKVTCDDDDEFSPERGYKECLAIKVFGNDKAKFKNYWYPEVSTKIFVDGVKIEPEPRGRWRKERKAEAKARKAEKLKLNTPKKAKK